MKHLGNIISHEKIYVIYVILCCMLLRAREPQTTFNFHIYEKPAKIKSNLTVSRFAWRDCFRLRVKSAKNELIKRR